MNSLGLALLVGILLPGAAGGDAVGTPRALVARESRPWDAHEKALLGSYLALTGLDAYQVGRMPEGFREGNPLLRSVGGDHPSTLQALAVKSLAAGGILYLVDRSRMTPRQRKAVLYLINAIQLYVVIRNERVTGGIVLR